MPCPDEYVPGTQAKHADFPSTVYNPDPQSQHELDDDCEEYVPAGQSEQLLNVDKAKLPGPHGSHEDDPGFAAKDPAEHGLHPPGSLLPVQER